MKKHVYVSKYPDKNGLIDWTQAENETWNTLILRQNEIIKNRACDEFISGIKQLEFPKDKVPQLPDINKKLKSITGWAVEGVPALIQPKEFFMLLANKKFPAATFIRIPEELDYLEEPDIFHEVYGHTPMLTNQTYADFMEEFGKKALEFEGKDRSRMFRLFWFTVEFGLIQKPEGIRAYGSGILSSIGETQYCMTDKCEKSIYEPLDLLRTPFRIDIMQPLYYVLDNFEHLFKVFDQDIHKLMQEARELGDFKPKFPPKDAVKESEPKEIDGAMSC